MGKTEIIMVLLILGVTSAVAFVGKIICQFLIDIRAFENNHERPPIFFRVRYFLPYTEMVPTKFVWMKKLCNLLYYTFLSSIFLYILLWNLKQ